ncbi:hypothetical protein DX980_20365 (plasmid) [Burkholderia gladioli]|uniref:hypothetical protein n=1 Tax=Burkholderia gladioli TaxID=28095 RepID=UPI001364E1DC|nr:hypothetical protein [Burkholderia gladioli]KAF1060711.1 hypothetical protein LvStA_03986 [Burkholderia gladioli]WAG21656.1 hypothetical protein DX980_20365 [Burkholderia gladioli]
MNTTRLRQGGLIAMWTISTVGIGIAVPWLVATAVVAWAAMEGGAVEVQQALAGVATLDGLQWRTSVPAFWSGLTWVSIAVIFAYRISQLRWTKDTLDRIATSTGTWMQNRVRTLYARLGGNPTEAGRLSIALACTGRLSCSSAGCSSQPGACRFTQPHLTSRLRCAPLLARARH